MLLTSTLAEPVMSLARGMPSMDIKREDISKDLNLWPDEPEARLQSEESYAGVAPGFCPGGGCGDPPLDWGGVSYDGPINFFGSGGISGTGGCVQLFNDQPIDLVDPTQPNSNTHVMSPTQAILCVLPIDSAIAEPDGSCPRP